MIAPLGFDQVAIVRTPVAAGDFTTRARSGLRCRLCRPGIQTGPANDERAEPEIRHFLMYDSAYLIPDSAQIEVEGERWNIKPGSGDLARGPTGAIFYRRVELSRTGEDL